MEVSQDINVMLRSILESSCQLMRLWLMCLILTLALNVSHWSWKLLRQTCVTSVCVYLFLRECKVCVCVCVYTTSYLHYIDWVK